MTFLIIYLVVVMVIFISLGIYMGYYDERVQQECDNNYYDPFDFDNQPRLIITEPSKDACDICHLEYMCGGHNLGNGIQYVIKFDKGEKNEK